MQSGMKTSEDDYSALLIDGWLSGGGGGHDGRGIRGHGASGQVIISLSG